MNRPAWTLVIGCMFGGLTLLFLMALVILNMIGGYAVSCANTYLVTLVFGLCVGLTSGFLGGYASLTGNIRVPWLGDQPLAVGFAGGIMFLLTGLVAAHFIIKETCVDRQSSLLKGLVKSIPANFDARPGSSGFYYTRSIDIAGRKNCVERVNSLPDGGSEAVRECSPYDFEFAIDTLSDGKAAEVSIYDEKSRERVCQIRLRYGLPQIRPGRERREELEDPLNANEKVTFRMTYTGTARAPAPGQLLNCFELSIPGSNNVYDYPVRITENGAEAYEVGIANQKVVLVRSGDLAPNNNESPARNRLEGSLALTPRSLLDLFRGDFIPAANRMPVSNLDPIVDLDDDDPFIQSKARKILARKFDDYQDLIWLSLTEEASDRTKVGLIGVAIDALRPNPIRYRDLSDRLPGVPKDKLALIVSLAVYSDSAEVRNEARRFMRVFPYDSVEAELSSITENMAADCAQGGSIICPRAAYAANYLYYNRIANVILKGVQQLTPTDVVLAEQNYQKALTYFPHLTQSAKVDFIAPIYAFGQVWLWGEMRSIVPGDLEGKHSSLELFEKIVDLASHNKEFYPYPHHIYSAVAATKNKNPAFFQKVLDATDNGAKAIDYPPGKFAQFDPRQTIYSGPELEGFKQFSARHPLTGQALSKFGDWLFYKFTDHTDAVIDFGWVNKSTTRTG